MDIYRALELLTKSPQYLTNSEIEEIEILDSIIDEYPITKTTTSMKNRTSAVLERVRTVIPKVTKYRPVYNR